MSVMTFSTPSSVSNRLRRVEASVPKAVAGKPVYAASKSTAPASSSVLANGQINPAGIATTGSAFPVVVQGTFGVKTSGTSISLFWDGTQGSVPFVIRRADGSNYSVPKGSLTVSGLQQATQYGFAPFVAVAQPGTVSFVAGDSGSPRFALSPLASAQVLAAARQTQQLAVNEALSSGLVYYSTSGTVNG